MLVYPQLGTGALAQYPVRKRRRLRTIVNRALDGSWIKCADPAAEVIEWELSYAGISDLEANALSAFFAAAEGRLNGFTFVDPTANLLAWSDRFDRPVWVQDPWLSATAGGSDPRGGTRAWQIANAGSAPQTLTQVVAGPESYLYCLSAYLRSASPGSVSLVMGKARASRRVGTGWTRVALAGQCDTMRFGIELPAGTAMDVFGMQLEPQTSPSAYQSSTRGGVYEDARLAGDTLSIRATGVNQHSCTIKISHANHL